MIVKLRMAGIGRMYINSRFHCNKYSNIMGGGAGLAGQVLAGPTFLPH